MNAATPNGYALQLVVWTDIPLCFWLGWCELQRIAGLDQGLQVPAMPCMLLPSSTYDLLH